MKLTHSAAQILVILLLLHCLFFRVSPADAEYNPASGEDDVVMISVAQEVNMGRSLAGGVEERFGLVKDPDMQKRVSDIGQRIVRVSDRPQLTYSFRVLEGYGLEEEQRFNAFALPGGYVYIFKDMVESIESDDELASIIAHETGHIVAKHSVKKLQSSIGMTGLNILGAFSKQDGRTQAKASFAIAQLMMAYNRKAEFEADKLSVKYLKEAGFDPNAAVTFMDKMLEKHLKGKMHHYAYFRTHPYASARKAMLSKEIQDKYAFDDYINIPPDDKKPYW